MEIHRGRGGVFLHLRLFLTSYPLLQETIQYTSNLSFPLSPRQVMSIYVSMKISFHLHIVAPFRDGLISLVDTLSGGMIRLMVSLSNKISSLPPTHLHEFHFTVDYMYFDSHDYYVLNLFLLYDIIKHRGRYHDEMISWLHWLYDFT